MSTESESDHDHDHRYRLGDSVPVDGFDEVPSGTNLLVTGSSMVGKASLVMRLLGQAPSHDERSLLVTLGDATPQAVTKYRRHCPSSDLSHLHVIDASGTYDPNAETGVPAGQIHTVSSPQDLTGIGIGVTKSVRAIGQDVPVRVGFLSISTLLQYADVERAFSFLHVMTGRLASVGHLGIFTLDPSMHEPRVTNIVTSLFDGVVELRETDDGTGREVRVRGIEGVSSAWTPLD